MTNISIINEDFRMHSLQYLIRDGHDVNCECRRCRYKWMEIEDSRYAQGGGRLNMCPRCLATKIDRIRYYKSLNDY